MQVSAVGRAFDNAAAVALFDLLTATRPTHAAHKTGKAHRPFPIAAPGIDAAFRAFENYIAIQNAQHQSLIAGAALYALTPKGLRTLTPADIAPFLALNLLA
jgi:hypothetical protein